MTVWPLNGNWSQNRPCQGTIHDNRRYCETGCGTSRPRPRSGRPPLLTDRDKRHLVKIVQSNRQQSAKQVYNDFVQSSGTVASLSTVRRALYEADYHSRVAVRKSHISVKNHRETDWNGAKDTKNGQMSNGKKSSGVMNLGLHCFKVMAELVYGNSQRRNMMLTVLFQQLSMVVEG